MTHHILKPSLTLSGKLCLMGFPISIVRGPEKYIETYGATETERERERERER